MVVDVQCPACDVPDQLDARELLVAYDHLAGGLDGGEVAWVCRHCSTLVGAPVSWWLLQSLTAQVSGAIDSAALPPAA